MTNRHAQTPAEWLIEQYDRTDNPFADACDDSTVLWHGQYVQPIFTLKGVMQSGHPMKITEADYLDTGRRFL